MVRRPGDDSPERPGGRVFERLRQFQESRRPRDLPTPKKTDEQLKDETADNGGGNGGREDRPERPKQD